jgi:hypothetical protein
MPPTLSQPFTVNAALVPTIVNVGGNGGGSSGGGENGSGGSISLSTTRSSNRSNRLPTIPTFHNLGAKGATGKSTSESSMVHIDKRAHEKYAKKFTRAIPILTEDLEEVEIIVPKNSCGMVGSKEYLLYQKLATESIEHKFGVPLHLVTDKSVAEDGDQTRHLYKMKVHHSLHAFEHEMESVPCKFELPSMLDAMHLSAFCSQINPLACLPVINAMANKFDQHDTAQHAVNQRMHFCYSKTSPLATQRKTSLLIKSQSWILSTHH